MEDLAPPPPPLETTTIGKYIARFRYEKPQPREVRVAAQQSEFWWTKSPRYSRSPSPPSTWASGGVFFDELDDELTATSEEIGTKIEEDIDSVENTLRRRLGISNDSKQGISNTREELKTTTPEVMQSWDSEEWGSVDLEEEDPDEVIERVRKRLGWSGASTLKPIEFQLSIDSNRDSGRRHWGMKPPLSPGLYRQEETLDSFGYRSSSSWSERGYRERFEEPSPTSSADVKDTSVVVETVGEKEPAHRGGVSLEEARETQSIHGELSPTGFAATTLSSSRSSVDSPCSQGSGPNEGSNDPFNTTMNASAEELDPTAHLGASESKDGVEEKKEKMLCETSQRGAGDQKAELPLPPTASPARPDSALSSSSDLSGGSNDSSLPDRDTSDQVPELPPLPPASPARPDLAPVLASPSSNGDLSGRSNDSSLSSPRNEELNSGESSKTLDSLVSSVLHDWENDLYSFPESESEVVEVSPVDNNQDHGTESRDGSNPTDYRCPPTTPPNENIPTTVKSSSGDQEFSSDIRIPNTVVSSAEKQETRLSEFADAVEESACNSDDEEKRDFEVPGEDNDEIVQMLLGRIALLEEALRHIDSS